MEIRQGLRVQREVQGGQVHLGGGAALRAGRVMSMGATGHHFCWQLPAVELSRQADGVIGVLRPCLTWRWFLFSFRLV